MSEYFECENIECMAYFEGHCLWKKSDKDKIDIFDSKTCPKIIEQIKGLEETNKRIQTETEIRSKTIEEIRDELLKHRRDICMANNPFNFIDMALDNVRKRNGEQK